MKSDLDLQKDVQEELDWEPTVNPAHIGVTAHGGVITLTGHVLSYPEKSAAEKAAKRVYGVMAVADELEVKLPSSSKRTDEDIAAACVSALKSNYSVPDEKVQVIVRNGWVTLEGEVDLQFQKNAAYYSTRNITGVLGVANMLKVKPHVAPYDVKSKIEAAFKRNAEIDARRIGVETRDGKVFLRGNVRSWAEREEAQQAAWAAPGVTAVENELVVAP